MLELPNELKIAIRTLQNECRNHVFCSSCPLCQNGNCVVNNGNPIDWEFSRVKVKLSDLNHGDYFALCQDSDIIYKVIQGHKGRENGINIKDPDGVISKLSGSRYVYKEMMPDACTSSHS